MSQKLSNDCRVKLLPTINRPDTPDAPLWGGVYGVNSGIIKTMFTHDHDPLMHNADVIWQTGRVSNVPATHLKALSNPEIEYAQDWKKSDGLLERDIFVLICTSMGFFVLNHIEPLAEGAVTPLEKYAAMFTRWALPSVDNSDYNLLTHFLSFDGLIERRCPDMFQAQKFIYDAWQVPVPKCFQHPLPEYPSLKEAAASCPVSIGKPRIAMFHLPRNLIDYASVD